MAWELILKRTFFVLAFFDETQYITYITTKQEVLMNAKICTSDLANPHEVLCLSSEAVARTYEIVKRKEDKEGLVLTKIFKRNDSIEWHFDDESIVELEVLRDFNDNMNPVAVIVTEWIDEPTIDNFYTIITRDRFELIQ